MESSKSTVVGNNGVGGNNSVSSGNSGSNGGSNSGSSNNQVVKLEFPNEKTLLLAAKLSLKVMKPIDLYFYQASFNGNVSIMNVEGEKIIFKNTEEHSSPILNTYKADGCNCYLVITENTIYLLSLNTKIDDGTS
jgi:hypothetical protein